MIQSSQCETTPVRPCTAAALATKLNERHNNIRPPSNMTSTATMSSADEECLNGGSDMGSMSPKIYKPISYPDKMPPLIPYHNNSSGGNMNTHNNNNIIDSKLQPTSSSSSSSMSVYQQSQSSGYSSNGIDTPQYSIQSNMDEKSNDINSIEDDEIQESPSTSIFECDVCMKTFKKVSFCLFFENISFSCILK